VPESTPDVYGSSILHSTSSFNIRSVFDTRGSFTVPLGHNEDDRTKGLVFNFGEGGNPGHGLTFGATRSGKGVNVIIPALLTYSGSMVVIDPKGENAWITAQFRREMGQRVVILDPWDEINRRYGSQVGVTEQITKFNPLAFIDPKSLDFNDEVAAVADALIISRTGGSDAHWTESARELVAGLIAAAVEFNPGKASLRDLRDMLTSDEETLIQRIKTISEVKPDSLAARKLQRFKTASNEVRSIRSTAETQTSVLDSEMLLASLETEEQPFDLAEIATGKVTLYLILPVDRLVTHGRWLRLILTMAIRTIARQPRPPQAPVVFMLDEMGTIGALSTVEQSYGLMAGLGIRIWGFLQDLPQLKRDYPHSWETFISNSSIIQVLNCGDETTSKYISDYLGNMTVNAKTGSFSNKLRPYPAGDSYGRRVMARLAQNFLSNGDEMVEERAVKRAESVYFASGKYKVAPDGTRKYEDGLQMSSATASLLKSIEQNLNAAGITEQGYTEWGPDEQLQSRPVMFPWEVRNSPPDTSIIIVPGQFNFRLKRFRYYDDPVFAKRARQDPNKPKIEMPKTLAASAAAGPNNPPRPAPGTIPPRVPTPEELAMWGPRFDTTTGKQIW